jgi:hypothetical protein
LKKKIIEAGRKTKVGYEGTFSITIHLGSQK